MSSDLRTLLHSADAGSWEPLDLSAVVHEARMRNRQRRLLQALAGTAAALALAFAGPSMFRQLAVQQLDTADQPKTEDAGRVETGTQLANDGPLGSGLGRPDRPTPGASPGKQGSSSPRTGEDTSSPRSMPQAGPPVFHTDTADDAYGDSEYAEPPPNAALNQPPFDILRVDWAPVSYVSEDMPGGYSISITIAGSARADGSYNSFGVFSSGNCQLYHSLIPGTTAFANALCGSAEFGTRRLIGQVQGGPVTTAPTAAGGTRISATFDNRAVPPELQAVDRTLHNLSAFTCMQMRGRTDCTYYDTLDNASSTLTYRV